MNWGIEDYVAAAILLGSAWLGIYLIRRNVHGNVLRPALIAAVILIVLIVWVELAVGIF